MTSFWLFVHLTGLVLLAAGVGIANLSGIMMSKAEAPGMIAMWSKLNTRAEHIATLPGALILIVAGSVLVHRDGYDYTATWVLAAYALWVLAVFLGAVVLGRHARRIHQLATDEAAAGVTTSVSAARLARSPLGPAVGNLLNVIVVVFLFLMVVRPG